MTTGKNILIKNPVQRIIIGLDKQDDSVFIKNKPFVIMARAGCGMTKPLHNLMAQMHKDGHNQIVLCDPKYEVIR